MDVLTTILGAIGFFVTATIAVVILSAIVVGYVRFLFWLTDKVFKL